MEAWKTGEQRHLEASDAKHRSVISISTKIYDEIGLILGCDNFEQKAKEILSERVSEFAAKYVKLELESSIQKIVKEIIAGQRTRIFDIISTKVVESLYASDCNDQKTPLNRVTVGELELSVRAHNVVKCMGVTFADELSYMRQSDILKHKNCGRKTVGEIRDVLDSLSIPNKL